MEEYIRAYANPEAALRALLWGVTPEIANLAWPAGSSLLSVDRSEEMIRNCWPGDVEGRRQAIIGEWLKDPDVVSGMDVVIGDCPFSQFPYPEGYRAMFERADQLLREDGVLISRFFAHPVSTPTVDEIFKDLLASRFESFHVFKFRLAMTMQESSKSGIRLGDVHAAWLTRKIDTAALQETTGWSMESIQTIDFYEGKDVRLWFASWEEIRTIASEFFEVLEHYIPTYEMGECCPIAAFRRKA